ncbi:MAG: hypothetical protein AB7U40_03765 [Methanobacteriales archaeon]
MEKANATARRNTPEEKGNQSLNNSIIGPVTPRTTIRKGIMVLATWPPTYFECKGAITPSSGQTDKIATAVIKCKTPSKNGTLKLGAGNKPVTWETIRV